jgi:hypothetical protein
MKKSLSLLCLLILAVMSVSPASAQAPTITFVNPPAGGVLELNVGDSYTFEVQVNSDQPFLLAQMTFSQYYPGRYIFSKGFVVARRTSSATLRITITAKAPTAELPGGVNPVSLVTGVHYKGKVVFTEFFNFGVRVN